MHACVEVRMKQLELHQPHTPLVDPRQHFAESLQVLDVPKETIAQLMRTCTPTLCNRGDTVPMGRGTCVFVAAGAVTLQGAHPATAAAPALLGCWAAVLGVGTMQHTAVADTLVMLVKLPVAGLQVLFTKHSTVEQRCWQYYAAECAATLQDSPWNTLPWQRLVWLCEASKLVDMHKGHDVSGALLLRGRVLRGDQEVDAPAVLPADVQHVVLADNTKLLLMNSVVPESAGILRFSGPPVTAEQQSFQEARRNAQHRAAMSKTGKSLKRGWRAQLPPKVEEEVEGGDK